jgi:UMF1 family MFS transporter
MADDPVVSHPLLEDKTPPTPAAATESEVDEAHPEATFAQKAAWVMYDWANSGYGLVVIGPIFSYYFITELLPHLDAESTGVQLAGIRIPGSAMMGILNSVSMALMAFAAPVLGAVADIKGWTKRLLVVHASVGSALTLAMYLLQPGMWHVGALLYLTSNFCFGTSFAFSNAFLPKLTHPKKQGSLSGWGFAMGYIGGALSLIIAGKYFSPRAALAFAGAWWLLFSLPAFILLPEFAAQRTERDTGPLLMAGWRRIVHTFKHIRQYRMLFLFLLAFLLYNDGIETVISMSPSFGTEVLKMTQAELVRMFLVVQFVAFFGAVTFGYLSDRLGNKPVILITLCVWVLAALIALFIRTPNQFTILGVVIGLVLGGVQASSRALMGTLAPKHIHNEAFGFFSISGKFASIFGPLLYAGFATAIGPRWGVLSVPPFLIAGLLILLRVHEPRHADAKPANAS